MTVRDLAQDIGLAYKRQEGKELVYTCPFGCEGEDKLYINSVTGQWQCFKGCGAGNARTLLQQLKIDDAEAFAVLKRFGLSNQDGRNKGAGKPSAGSGDKKKKKKSLSWLEKNLREPSDDELNRLCAARNIDKTALKYYRPSVSTNTGQVVLHIPVYEPADMPDPCGYIRMDVDGGLIKLKSGKEERYASLGSKGLYGLPDTLLEKDTTFFVFTEGVRDLLAAHSLGYRVIGTGSGAGKWLDSWGSVVKRKSLYIIPDADEPGIKGALKIAKLAYQYTKDIKIVYLPYEVQKKDGKDLHDFIREDGHTRADVDALIEAAKQYQPPEEPEYCEDDFEDGSILEDGRLITMAEHFYNAAINNKDIRYRYHPMDGWSIFQGDKYRRVLADETIETHINRHLNGCGYLKKGSFIALDMTTNKTKSVLRQLKVICADDIGGHVIADTAAPCSLDGSVDPKHVIATDNMLVDIINKETKPLDENFYTFNYLPYPYDPDAISDKWGSFLCDITNHNVDLMVLLQMWAGYLLIPGNEYQKFLLCVGDGANGKFVFFDTLAAAIGKENVSTVPLAHFDDLHKLFGSYGKLVNMSNENAKSLEANAESVLKEYVGGDKMMWERKYKDAFFAYPTAKLMFATNVLPTIRDTSDGVWRRMLYLPFDVQIPEEKRDPRLAEKLQQPEDLTGILNWMIEGREMLIKNKGFYIPDICREKLNTYRDESNSARMFVSEYLENDESFDTRIHKGKLYRLYQQWCKDNGCHAKGDRQFGKDLYKFFNMSKEQNSSRIYDDGQKVTVHLGLKFQSGMELGHDTIV